MTDYSELKRLCDDAGNVDWGWWTSNSTLRLTTESDGRHGTDGDAISAHKDSVECPEIYRVFIGRASPANVSALIAENARLDEDASMRAIRSLRADYQELIAERDQLKADLHTANAACLLSICESKKLKFEKDALIDAMNQIVRATKLGDEAFSIACLVIGELSAGTMSKEASHG